MVMRFWRHLGGTSAQTYQDDEVVQEYVEADELLPPEARVLGEIEVALPSLTVLDLGVGGGRTTAHLATKAGRYLASDFSLPMVRATRDRFPGISVHPTQADARAIPLTSESVDLILFSFNGIDYVDHDGRRAALGEMWRVLKPGGTLFFSCHNLRSVRALYSPRPQPGEGKRAPIRAATVLALNGPPGRLIKRQHAIVNDGAHAWGLRTYYVQPAEQVGQIRAAGFSAIRVLDGRGQDVEPDAVASMTDPWIHFVVTKDSSPR